MKSYLGGLASDLHKTHGIDPRNIELVTTIELLSNALKHAFPDGQAGAIHVDVWNEDPHMMVLRIRDTGVGLPADVDIHQTKSFGLQLVRLLVSQLHGTMTIERSEGTTIEIRFSAG